MPDLGLGLSIGGSLLGSIIGGDSAENAADTQAASAEAGIAEQRRQFDAIRALLSPYVEAGTGALAQQQATLGQLGNYGATGLQQAQNSPLFAGLLKQGEQALLQNASATGGLRGGNTQGALANLRVNLLSQLENQQYGRLNDQFNRAGALTSLGQNAAAGVGNAGAQSGIAIANLLGRQGSAEAGGIIGQGNALINGANQIGGILAGRFGQPATQPIGPTTFPAAEYALGSVGSGLGLRAPRDL